MTSYGTWRPNLTRRSRGLNWIDITLVISSSRWKMEDRRWRWRVADSSAASTTAGRAAGTIYDLGYQHYDGARYGRWHVIRTLTAFSFSAAFGSGRGSRARDHPDDRVGARVPAGHRADRDGVGPRAAAAHQLRAVPPRGHVLPRAVRRGAGARGHRRRPAVRRALALPLALAQRLRLHRGQAARVHGRALRPHVRAAARAVHRQDPHQRRTVDDAHQHVPGSLAHRRRDVHRRLLHGVHRPRARRVLRAPRVRVGRGHRVLRPHARAPRHRERHHPEPGRPALRDPHEPVPRRHRLRELALGHTGEREAQSERVRRDPFGQGARAGGAAECVLPVRGARDVRGGAHAAGAAGTGGPRYEGDGRWKIEDGERRGAR